jgi:DNA-binding MarR family transcriptional regulator
VIFKLGYRIGYWMKNAYTKHQLGELQQKILKHIFNCTADSENASHIAKALGLKQPTVYESVQSLIKDKFLQSKRQSHKRGEKVLQVTHKGAAAAVMLGISFENLENYTKKYDTEFFTFFVQALKRITTTVQKRDLLIKMALEYALKNNFFEQGYLREINAEETKKFQLYIASEYTSSLGPATNIKNLKEFVDRYELDKEYLKAIFSYQKNIFEKFLNELSK